MSDLTLAALEEFGAEYEEWLDRWREARDAADAQPPTEEELAAYKPASHDHNIPF